MTRSKVAGWLLIVAGMLGGMPATAVTLQFHAWGGSAQVNDYLQWVAGQVEARHGITLKHVKLADTSDAVARVLAEKAAGNHDQGAVDLIWINGENFAAMQRNNLLLKNWVSDLPNFKLTNPAQNPAMTTDFGLPTRGQEAPWGKAALVFYYNQRYLSAPPQNVQALLSFAHTNPGRFTYPLPNDYLGISFLKYVLLALNADNPDLLYAPVNADSFAQVTRPLWAYLDKLHPVMWRQGDYMVRQASHLQQLMGSGELLLAFSFTAAEIPGAVTRYDLPETVRTYAMQEGSLANVHFVGISYNTAHPDAARQVVNFLLSPEAQARKQQLAVWGDETVLDLSLLPKAARQRFVSQSSHPAALPAGAINRLLPEPHSSWTDALREAWFERYGARW
ncbi:ABC transporter substrate-binding protein [Alteromonas sp. ASW11-19]|uniref:ABC transporter substrate-binding protein n=1 Tax=Alteromonas salexigens TaxID=2982530 RepID=A0ABT2VLD3_9ALTE|nr:ABC transporter substrate-binding protein [Alteromonas salexigens]MCU7553258.1 ABC transporter substrate-binding protein [Alteromonas salexigens]